MEYKRISNRLHFSLLLFMLKGDSMKRECDCKICRDHREDYKPSVGRYQPAKIQYKPKGIKATLNTERYLKLHNGDIYDCDTNSILNRLSLQDFMG